MIGTKDKLRVDPIKLNRGQPIHFKGRKPSITDSVPKSYEAFKSYNQNVEKKGTEWTEKLDVGKVDDVVFIDWFEQTILTADLPLIDPLAQSVKLADGLFLENSNGRTSHYAVRWNVIYLGELFATVLSHPIKSFMKPNQLQFKIENQHLYRVDWLDCYKDILGLTNWKPLSNTRVDIAIDGKAGDTASRMSSRHINGSVVGRKGKAVMTIGYLPNKSIKGFHVGSPNSEKSATIYNKSQDIARTEKQYITSAWKQNNLVVGKADVKRFEIRMRAKVANNYDWTRLDDVDYLATIVRTECKNWFEFYYKGKDKNKHRNYKNKSMEWIDWNSIRGELLPKNKSVAKSGLHRAKRIIKDSLYMKHVEGKRIDSRLISELKREYVLHKWFDDRIDSWLAQWEREKRFRTFGSN